MACQTELQVERYSRSQFGQPSLISRGWVSISTTDVSIRTDDFSMHIVHVAGAGRWHVACWHHHDDVAAPEATMCHPVLAFFNRSVDQSDRATWKSIHWHGVLTWKKCGLERGLHVSQSEASMWQTINAQGQPVNENLEKNGLAGPRNLVDHAKPSHGFKLLEKVLEPPLNWHNRNIYIHTHNATI
jgi:hypothetical protein